MDTVLRSVSGWLVKLADLQAASTVGQKDAEQVSITDNQSIAVVATGLLR